MYILNINKDHIIQKTCKEMSVTYSKINTNPEVSNLGIIAKGIPQRKEPHNTGFEQLQCIWKRRKGNKLNKKL